MNFYTNVIKTNLTFKTKDRVSAIHLLEPEFRRRMQNVIEEAKLHGHELRIIETYRSRERQLELFNQKKTKLRNVGVHHYGLAADVVKIVNGKAFWGGDWSFLGKLAEKHKLIWGGDWGFPNKKTSFYDAVHLQMVSVKDQAKLFRGSWYPQPDYNPYENL
jgi:hypothetical protein